jgi:hypothetical protein
MKNVMARAWRQHGRNDKCIHVCCRIFHPAFMVKPTACWCGVDSNRNSLSRPHFSLEYRLLHSSKYLNEEAVEEQAVLHMFSLDIILYHSDCADIICMQSRFFIIITSSNKSNDFFNFYNFVFNSALHVKNGVAMCMKKWCLKNV